MNATLSSASPPLSTKRPSVGDLRHAVLRFSMPVNAEQFVISSVASQAAGSISLDIKSTESIPSEEGRQNGAEDQGKTVDIDIDLSYFSESALNRATVCLQNEGGKWELVIVVSHNYNLLLYWSPRI